jgi:hypothetical protein
MKKSERLDFIRASGMGEYTFCARAWWLRRAGVKPTRGGEARAAGTRWHKGHGRSVERAKMLRRLSALCLYAALAFAALLLLTWWRG